MSALLGLKIHYRKKEVRMKEKIDILIRNGLSFFDGTGSEPNLKVIIGIKDDRIVFVTSKTDMFANKIIDAKGLIVAPGFIDTHAHSDFTILADPLAEGKIFQGITTEINGNCGLSAAPLLGELIKCNFHNYFYTRTQE